MVAIVNLCRLISDEIDGKSFKVMKVSKMKKVYEVLSLMIFIMPLIFLCQGCIFLNSEASNSAQKKYLEIQTKSTDNAIRESVSLQELNSVCTNVSLPEGFAFVSKGGIDDQKISLAYHYSSRISFDEARKSFERYFAEKGWSEEDLSHRYPKQLDFTDGNYRIAVNYAEGNEISNYSIYCEKLKK